ncbi:DUF4189 domain-containing protein [Nocardia otitidiscaviarum]|uniref:DUF4189 domain-containing protein n=1 Tax=Nocardia otitidiscaviarum TaxID=1823 RepID=A0A516NT71_9NOCA|nr:DUF4189 domain-containing protein [Nocardia otitidiscaviarum]MCP9621391.1 DUF4189 domain-containing protein [Nocardia otitidiscaviarum]QDP82097.1 DUF4189 domain-containing protein [Nocardia otitidiscaviarum]
MRKMSKIGGFVAAAGLVVGSLAGAGAANAAGDQFASIAFSPLTWQSGVGVNTPSFETAEQAALADCGMDDCEIWASWANGCGVIVESGDGFAVASGPTRKAAEDAAYSSLGEYTPTAPLASFGSSELSGAWVHTVVCTANAV